MNLLITEGLDELLEVFLNIRIGGNVVAKEVAALLVLRRK